MYLDTSVLTKLFVAEPDSEACAFKIGGATVVSSELAYGEIFSAILRKERAGAITAGAREESWAEFERQVARESVWLETLDGSIIRRAQEIMLKLHPRVALRTLDAIHLGTCLSLVAVPLFTMDRRMREAAALLEIPLVT